MVKAVKNHQEVLDTYGDFLEKLKEKTAVACMFVLDNFPGIYSTRGTDAITQIEQIAKMMAVLSDVPVHDLMNESILAKRIRLCCPITGKMTTFADFNVVAFYPVAGDKAGHLYDPSMAAPVCCANLTSDIYAFSMLVRDQSLAIYGCEVWDLPDNETRRKLFEKNVDAWQHFAIKTIDNYVEVTDTHRCPIFVAKDQRSFYANHRDPVFAETRKNVYRHHMPIVYVRQLVELWMRFYEKDLPLELSEVARR
jgi:hypothetical protein